MFDRRSETEDFIPVADDLFPIYNPTNERRERPRRARFARLVRGLTVEVKSGGWTSSPPSRGITMTMPGYR